MTDDPLHALIGGEPARKSKRRRAATPAPEPQTPADLGMVDLSDIPSSSDEIRQHAVRMAGGGRAFIDAGVLRQPVSKGFLATVFQMDPATVTKRLLTCPPLGRAGGQREMYDFREAVAYLIPPKMDLGEYIESLDPNDMPNHINKVYWEARRIRLKFMLEAGDAWATDDVLDVLSAVNMKIKDRTQLWTETLREVGGLNDDQYRRLTEMVDALLGDLHADLVDIPKQRQTLSLAKRDDGAEVEG